MGLRGFSMPEEIYFLCMLHNIGAVSSEKSMTLEEVARWTALEPEKARTTIHKLVEANYVGVVMSGGIQRYHVTLDGIRKVLSMYS